ncbi:MAG: DUF4292 domain-containing protein [Flavitalea sp.]
MRKFNRIFLFVFVAAGAVGCRSTKSIQHAMSRKDSVQVILPPANNKNDSVKFMQDVYHGVIGNRIPYTSFQAKIKVNFEGSNGKKNDFNAFLRLQKDSMLWVSINALLGIEAFRILITPDSVKVLNKIDKVIQLRSMSYLKEITKLPFTFGELQDLIVGNPIYLSDSIVSFKKEGERVTIVCMGDIFKNLLTLNPNTFIIQHSKLDDLDQKRARTADITYEDYEKHDTRNFSTSRKITFSEKSKLDIEMKFKQYDFNIPLNFPFNIPKNYKLQ